MSTLLIDYLHEAANKAVREALDAVGLQEVESFKLMPPAEESMGDLGLPCHPFARVLRKNPKVIAEEVVANLPKVEGMGEASALNGYVNLRFDPAYFLPKAIEEVLQAGDDLGFYKDHSGENLLIEFSGPNTNKPQHLGHVRNNVTGLAMANLYESVGYKLIRTNIINDRGIHICKSMLAYQLWGDGKTPESSGRKGDFLVGDFYVLFDQKFNTEVESYIDKNPGQFMKTVSDKKGNKSEVFDKEKYFNEGSDLGAQAKKMLEMWESGDEAIHELWKKMNGWVYDGFGETYKRLGISFDWVDYESDTYILGKKVVEDGMEKGAFHKREDGAIVCDLAKIGKENDKVLLRPNGTSVYMTQDLGTAMRRFEKFDPQKMIYVVADEQNYHFEVLFGLLDLLEEGKGSRCHHLSYGMVDLPHGRMKSREGTVVDADNLMNELRSMALEKVKENYPNLSEEEQLERAEKVGQAGLKFYILKHTPATRMKFDPEKSISFHGETGPYCLYAYARVNSIASKLPTQYEGVPAASILAGLGSDLEVSLGKRLVEFPAVVRDAAEKSNPARVAQHTWLVAKALATLYQDNNHHLLNAEPERQEALFSLIKASQQVIGRGLALLGIETIPQM